MCDFRHIIKVEDIQDNKQYDVDSKYAPHYDTINLCKNPQIGLYHVGMSGCGYVFYNGLEFVDEGPRYKFISNGYISWR